jgi:hypothetical protein
MLITLISPFTKAFNLLSLSNFNIPNVSSSKNLTEYENNYKNQVLQIACLSIKDEVNEYFLSNYNKKPSKIDVDLYQDEKGQYKIKSLIIYLGESLENTSEIKKELNISATLILFTPLEETLPYIRRNNGIILVAAGDKDRYLNSEKLATICKLESVSYYIEHGIGHRMEVMNDLQRNLTVVENVISRLQV